jgi:WD40 repeat protein
MFFFKKIKTIQISRGAIWSLKWSTLGTYLIACGIDGFIFIFGFSQSKSPFDLEIRSFIERKNFYYYNCIALEKKKKP